MIAPLEQGFQAVVFIGVLAVACLIIGFGYPGAGGKIAAALVFALPFLAIALFVSIVEAVYGGVSGQEPGYRGAGRVLLDAVIAGVAGVGLAFVGGLLRRMRGES